ncbi:MAG: hypothetical protein M1818_004021 [Claussenomyces sp. TS43310]|nr:MAG: hypothetical protein M1818_004021 [Claussenomyces sp. TS43310]
MSSLFGALGNSQTKPAIFGAQPSTGQTGTSPFTALNASKPAQATTSLFGSTAQTPQQAGGSLFGAPTSQPQHQSGGGLFGSAVQPQQSTGGSLFGGTSQSQPSGGLFGSTPQPQQPSGLSSGSLSQSKMSGGLFGGTALAAQPGPGNSTMTSSNDLLGNRGTQQSSQTEGQASGAYFDSILERSRKRAHGETALEELPSLQLGLGDLRERIRKLGPSSQTPAIDGRAEFVLAGSGVDVNASVRNLSYLDAQTSRVERATPAHPPNTDVASYLATLQHQTTLSMISDALARSVQDFDDFMAENMSMEWDAQRKRIYQHFGIKPRDGESNLNGAYSARSEISEQGGFGRSRRTKTASAKATRTGSTQTSSIFGRPSLQKSIIGTPKPIGARPQIPFVDVEKKVEAAGIDISQADDRLRHEKQVKFAEKVQNLNAARLQSRTYPILHEFCEVDAQTGEDHVEHVVKAYRAMIEIVGEKVESQSLSDPSAIKERHLAEAYLDEAQNSANVININKRILHGASRHLEKQFFLDLEAFVAKNPRDANLGGVPNVLSKVRAFVRLRAARKDLVPDDTLLQMINDDYAWALCFYLLRSGHVREAVEYVAANAVAFRAIDRNFATYITDYYQNPDRRLRRELQDRINNEYIQRVRIAPEKSIDPFRMACYNVIGRCDMARKSLDGLVVDWPDWLWLQFILAREADRTDEVGGEVYGLREVQATVDNVVLRHSQGATGFGVFFFLQILSGRFEQAISFLYSYQYIDAVHFAIALDYYGMLRVTGPLLTEGDLLSFNVRELPQLSFARMIGYYTQDFRAANVTAAVDYLVLICLNTGPPSDPENHQATQCHEALRELIFETRDFAQLLGDVKESGERVKGAIEERVRLIGLEDSDDFMRTVTLQAANAADDNGRSTDAVLLYHLAGDYDNVIAICNRAMSEALAADIGQEEKSSSMRHGERLPTNREEHSHGLSLTSFDNPVALTNQMLYLYRNFPENISPQNRNTCLVLRQIYDARKLITEEKWPPALDVLAKLDIIPLGAQGDSTRIRQCAAKYSSFDQTIIRLIPNLIIWSIRCCMSQRSFLMGSQFGGNDGSRFSMMTELKSIAKDLMMYSGFLKYRLPSSVNDALARIAAE